jgi:hypothetical protein
VRLHHCFVPSPPAPFSCDTLGIEFLASHSNSAEVKWHPSCDLSFAGLEIMAVPGQRYSIKPHCRTKNASIITFSSSCDWLEWDQISSTFIGTVPVNRSTLRSPRSRGLKITITATIIQKIDKTVCFKQKIRTSVNIPIHAMREAQLCSGLQDRQYGRLGRKFETVHVVEGHCRPVQRRKGFPVYRWSPPFLFQLPKRNLDQRVRLSVTIALACYVTATTWTAR